MSGLDDVVAALYSTDWFDSDRKVHCLVDGQFGSTGKGVAASLLEHTFEQLCGSIRMITMTNAGPNSGHTAVYRGHQIITRQVTVSAAQRIHRGGRATCYLNAGAIIDASVLLGELANFGFVPSDLGIHPNAAVIWPIHVEREQDSYGAARIASTGKGVGAAIAEKIMRTRLNNIAESSTALMGELLPRCIDRYQLVPDLLETAQGFSLGVNQRFYPYCTSRECTVMQALSDACIHPYHLGKTMMAVRTFPIRVGNTDKGYSGDVYPDQHEVEWQEIGVKPELTTVTKRQRRIFTWSRLQFIDAVKANRPNALFVNFMQYLPEHQRGAFMRDLLEDYRSAMLREPDAVIIGWSANTEDVTLWT